MSTDTIVLDDVRKRYQSSGGVATEALRGVSLTVPSGDFLAIKGPSGSGKSSLLHVIGLLDQGFEGSYELDGQPVGRLGKNQAAELRNRKIGFIFQQFNLLKRAKVLQNVLLPTLYHSSRDDAQRAMEVIRRVGLLEHIDKKSNQLSGGQIQRVAIARALIMSPSLLLADEPTGNLDTKTAHEIMDLFAEINSAGTTIVLITHEDDIAAYARRLVRLVDGVIAEEVMQ